MRRRFTATVSALYAPARMEIEPDAPARPDPIAWLGEMVDRLRSWQWTTVRSATVEFGRPPGEVYRAELAEYTDAELYACGEEILAGLRARDAAWGVRR